MANTVSRRSVVYDILFEVEQGKKSAKEAQQALNKLGKEADDVEGSVKKLGKAFLGAFAIQDLTRRLIQFTTEAVNLARASEGVRRAFGRLNDPNILNELRTATRGAISDLQLMQAAVRAQNFKIPLQQLGTFFDFASKRARDTGQSVDYLVNSIIDGIGRKSTLVLDNLGLSASEIQSEFAKTGDLAVAVGNIIQREMGGAASDTDLAAESIDRYNAAIENLKEKIGTELIPVLGKAAELMLDIFSRTAVEDLQKTRKALTDEFEGIIERAPQQFQKLIQGLDASQIKILKIALEIAKSTGKPIEDLIILEGIVGNATIGFTALGDAMRMTKKEAEELAAAQAAAAIKVLTPFEQLNQKVIDFGKVLKEVWRGEADANIKALNDQLTELKKELTETDLPRNRVIELTEKIKTLEAALKSLFETGKEMPDFEIEFSDPLKRLNDLIDESNAKSEKLRQELEELSKIKFEVPEETSDALTKENEEKERLIANLEKERQMREQLSIVAQSSGLIFSNLAKLAGDASAASTAFSIASVIAANAEALAKGVAQAISIGFPQNIAAVFTTIATVTSVFAQIKSIADQANAAQNAAKANKFAEGEVDIHRPGETRGKDSIPAVIMPGESVITTDKTAKYKPFLKAIHEGTLEDLIRVNYVEPALAITAMEQAEKDSTVDYSQRFYKQLLATADGNSINKKAVRTLERIEKKIGNQKPSWYV